MEIVLKEFKVEKTIDPLTEIKETGSILQDQENFCCISEGDPAG